MPSYVLTCCSTADLDAAHIRERDIPYVCFHYIIDDVAYPDDLGQSVSFPAFYQKLREGAMPTTAQVNVQQFLEFFEPFLKEGKDVLHVSLSSGISGAFNAANTAKAQLCEKYPARRVEIVDSLSAALGYGLFMDLLADKRDEGVPFEELFAFAEETKHYVHHWFFASDLSAFIRGGRISKTAGFFGSLLGVCPLLRVDDAGRLIPHEKVRTKKKVKAAIVERMKEHVQDGLNYSGRCYISHSDCLEDAEDVAALIEASFPNLKGRVQIGWIGTVIGSHTGCGTVALFFMGDKRTVAED